MAIICQGDACVPSPVVSGPGELTGSNGLTSPTCPSHHGLYLSPGPVLRLPLGCV